MSADTHGEDTTYMLAVAESEPVVAVTVSSVPVLGLV
jgi:hypothetical protein